jgi:hypothetical protein
VVLQACKKDVQVVWLVFVRAIETLKHERIKHEIPIRQESS